MSQQHPPVAESKKPYGVANSNDTCLRRRRELNQRPITAGRLPIQTDKQADLSQLSRPLESVKRALHSPGQPLAPSTRLRYERHFGHDFSQVRIHTGNEAAKSASSMSASAYTVGSHIVFGRNTFQPSTSKGSSLLAHELTHVVQDGRKLPSLSNLAIDSPHSPQEHEATFVSNRFSSVENFLDSSATSIAAKSSSKSLVRPARSKLESIKAGPEDTNTRIVFTNYSRQHLKQDLAKANLLVRGVDNAAVKIRNPSDKLMTDLFRLEIVVTSFTDSKTKKAIDKLFPPNVNSFLVKKTDGKKKRELYKIVESYRKGKPSNFSSLQVHNLLAAGADPKKCIGTMNKGFQNLHGSKTVEKGDLSDTAFGTIGKLEEKGLATQPFKIAAKYNGKDFPIEKDDASHLAQIGMNSIPQTLIKKLKGMPDGAYVFAFSLANGFHSITLVVYQKGKTHEFMWRDQNGTELYRASRVDNKAKRFLADHTKSTIRKQYNKTNGTKHKTFESVPKGDTKYKNALAPALRTVNKDFKENLFVLLKPS